MYSNPVIRLLLLILGAFFLLRFFAGVSAPLHAIFTLLAGLIAAALWMLRWERQSICQLYTNYPWTHNTLEFIAKYGQVPSPCADVGHDKSTSLLLLKSVEDLERAKTTMKKEVIGYPEIVDTVLVSLFDSLKFREKAPPQPFPPLGMFLFIGADGLGKQYLATKALSHLYDGGAYIAIDINEYGQNDDQLRHEVIELIQQNPSLGIIIENIDVASDGFKNWLLKLYKERSLTDSKSAKTIPLERTVFFLLVHRDSKALDDFAHDSTVHAKQFADLSKLPEELIWYSRVASFQLPDQNEWMDIVAAAMAEECRRHGLQLGSVSKEIMFREVAAISRENNFKMLPGRINKRLEKPIKRALAREQQVVEI